MTIKIILVMFRMLKPLPIQPTFRTNSLYKLKFMFQIRTYLSLNLKKSNTVGNMLSLLQIISLESNLEENILYLKREMYLFSITLQNLDTPDIIKTTTQFMNTSTIYFYPQTYLLMMQ